jgi:hypothetical protein
LRRRYHLATEISIDAAACKALKQGSAVTLYLNQNMVAKNNAESPGFGEGRLIAMLTTQELTDASCAKLKLSLLVSAACFLAAAMSQVRNS